LSSYQIRYWIKTFSEFFEGSIEKGSRWEVYNIDAIEKAIIIGAMIKTSTHIEVKEALIEAGYASVIEMVEKSTTTTISSKDIPTTTTINNNISELKTVIEMLEIQRDIIDHQREIIAELKARVEELEK